MVTATSRQVRDRAWAQAQQKVPQSDGSRSTGTTRESDGIHGIHGTTSDGATGAGAFPRSADRELLNRGRAAGLDTEFDRFWVATGYCSKSGKKLLAKLEKEELDAMAFRVEKPLK